MLLNQCLAISLTEASQQQQDGSATREAQGESWAASLFDRLISQNLQHQNKQPEEVSSPKEEEKEDEEEQKLLGEALRRVEFAGFVVPSWLLLSGSYGDLARIKTSWSGGLFKSPNGFKIETIGNIRSVNVDYFSAASEELGKRCFAPLDACLLESLQELSGSGGVHVSRLMEHLAQRYARQLDLPRVEDIDCAINGLLRAGRIQTRPMSQRQMAEQVSTPTSVAGRQSVFVDRLLSCSEQTSSSSSVSPTNNNNNNKSRSTTLDSGIRSWVDHQRRLDSPASSGSNGERGGGKATRGFSLRRSLSFRPSGGRISGSSGQQEAAATPQQRQTLLEMAKENREPTKPKLASLFRSRSMRAMGGRRADWTHHHHREATIDYLAPVAHYGRRTNDQGDGHALPGRLLHFLRRLFRGSHQSQTRQQVLVSEPISADSGHFSQEEPQKPQQQQHTSQPTPPMVSKKVANQMSASPSASSSNSDSLIQILDCSPALANSRRPLHETQWVGARPGRASRRRLVERSNSALSQSSCSTTKSTASQQLRRHLDEAYRRHRKCTSQRERDFLDSINVLRQASRHALLEAPAKSGSSAGRAKSALSGSGVSDEQEQQQHHCGCSLNRKQEKEPQQQQPHQGGHQDSENNNNNHPTIDLKLDDEGSRRRKELLSPDSLAGDCCLCAPPFCPALACCPAATSFACCAATAAVAPGAQMRRPQLAGETALAPELACCPLWRSLLYDYNCNYNYNHYANYINNYAHYPLPLALQQLDPAIQSQNLQLHHHQQQPHQQHQQPLSQMDNQLMASSQQLHQHQQQHQHNTTIDLKIEIGDLLGAVGAAAAAAKSLGPEESRWKTPPPLVVEPDDSLDSDLATDESLNRLDLANSDSIYERDSAD